MDRRQWLATCSSFAAGWASLPVIVRGEPSDDSIRAIGDRRELFLDTWLIESLQGARLALQQPLPRELVLKFDRPWEGLYCGYETVVQDADQMRLYYRGLPVARHSLDTEVTCVATSRDGIEWEKPNLGQFEVQGTRQNNVVLARSRGCHNLAPFVDTRPDVEASQRYKALGGTGKPGLLAFASHDGLHWRPLQEQPVITQGAFDSQNNAFWSVSESCYVCYFRVFVDGVRWIARTTSADFINWDQPVVLEVGEQPRQHLYTNQFDIYPRAPHLYIGMPTRFFPGRRVVSQEEAEAIGTPAQWNYANDCTDIVLATSRGGAAFDRTFMEALVRPGRDLRNWTSRANYAVRGFVQSRPDELSFYIKHNSGYPSIHVRRYSLRTDGFASVQAGFSGGELLTRPLTFQGRQLTLNFATSAAGSLQVELQSADGRPLPGFELRNCRVLIGDRIDYPVSWKENNRLAELAGQPVRLRVVMKDADLYSLRFTA